MSARSRRLLAVALASLPLLAGASAAIAQQNVKQIPPPTNVSPRDMIKPQVVVSPTTSNIGVANPNEIIRTVFTFTNNGKKPLVVKETKAACSCTQAVLAPTTIPVGGKATLNVTIDLRGSSGPVDKDVQVYFEGNPVPVTVKTVGTMSFAVAAEPAAARPDAHYSGQIELRSIDGRAFKVLAINGQPPTIIARKPEGGERAVSNTFSYKFEPGNMPNLIVVETDHPDAPVIDVPVFHQETSTRENEYISVLRDIFIMRKGLNIGVITPEKPVEYKIQIQLGQDRKPGDVTLTTESEDITAEIIDSKPYLPGPGYEYTVRVTSKAKREGYLLTPFYFQVDDKKTRIWGAGLLKNQWPVKPGSTAATTPASSGSGS